MDINYSMFKVLLNNEGSIERYTYTSKSPYHIYVSLYPLTNSFTVEVGAKILKDNYPNLITKESINSVFFRISELGLFRLDSNKIMLNSTVSKVDITKDIQFEMNDELKQIMMMFIRDGSKWIGRIRKNNGIDVTKDVKSKRCKERISLYDKHSELLRPTNRPFLETLINPNGLMNLYKGVTRIECNLVDKLKIKELLEIEDTTLQSVLNSKANPILKIFDKVFAKTALPESINRDGDYLLYSKLNDYYKSLLWAENGNDERKVKTIVNHFYAAKTNKRSVMSDLRRVRNIKLATDSRLNDPTMILMDLRNNLI